MERKKFKSLGFNKSYEFNQSDFLICHDLLIVMLDQYSDQTALDAFRYLVGEVNYGGRVIDCMDQRLLNCYINDYFSETLIIQ